MSAIRNEGWVRHLRPTYSWLVVALLSALTGVACAQLPIKPARTISFTTEEGSAMSVDISPDGHTLIFDLLGNLYTVPATGGEAVQITEGLAVNLRPVWSPDGKQIAFLSDSSGAWHVNICNPSGKHRGVLGESTAQLNYWGDVPVWSIDGQAIAAGNMVYGVTDGTIAPATPATASRFSHDGFHSPDGQWISSMENSSGTKRLVVKNAWINVTRVLVPSLNFQSPGKEYPTTAHSFSPDSKLIYIAYGGKIHRITVDNGADQIIPFNAHVTVDLGAFDYHTFRVAHDAFDVRYTRSAIASPDGKHVVFSALNRLYVIDLPAGKARVIAPQSISQYQPVYSPDGQWIAYVSWCDSDGGFLWRVPAAGGAPQQLTTVPGQYQRPAWSPDGTLIAVVRGAPELGDRDDAGGGQLELVPAGGGPERVLVDSVPLWNQLAFTTDGKRLIYEPSVPSDGDSLSTDLNSVDLSGKNPQVVAIARSGEIFPAWHLERTLSPDGRYIVYVRGEDLYLRPVATGTGPIVLYDRTQSFRVIRFAHGVDPHWELGGKMLSWSYGNKFYRINPDKVVAAVAMGQTRTPIEIRDDTITVVHVVPDQAVDLEVTVPTLYAHGTIALRDVRIITMRDTSVIEHGTIVIKDGRFSAVGPVNAIRIPKEAKVLDLPGMTIMPGFVDLHLHMRVPPDVFPQQSWMYLANLAYGVTTARDPSASYDSFGYAELLATGQMIGPRLFSSGRAVRTGEGIRVDHPEDAQSTVDKRALMGGTYVKQYLLPTRLQREWLLLASEKAGLSMTNEGDFVAVGDVAMIMDGTSGIEHNLDWGDAYQDLFTLFAKSGTFLTPTLQVRPNDVAIQYFSSRYWHAPSAKLNRFLPDRVVNTILQAEPVDTTNMEFFDFRHAAMVDARIRHEGGRVGLGSHGNSEGIGVHNELWALQMGGLTNMEALQAGTIVGAEALGIQRDVGSIEVGKIADLIVLDENPLDDIHNSRAIRYVMKDGVLYDGETLSTIWPASTSGPAWRLHGTLWPLAPRLILEPVDMQRITSVAKSDIRLSCLPDSS